MATPSKGIDIYGGDSAEKALISALLIAPRMYPEVASIVTANDFRQRSLAAVYNAIVTLSAAGQRVDVITVANALANCNDVPNPPMAWLTGLLMASPSSLGAEDYARIVKDWSLRRAAILAAQQLVAKAASEEVTQAELVGWLAKQSEALSQPPDTQGSISATMGVLFDRAEQFADGKQAPGVKTSFPILDKLFFGGWQAGALYLLAARPGVGKSVALTQAATFAAMDGKRVLLWSGEMSQESVLARILSARCWSVSKVKIAPAAITTGRVSGDDWNDYVAALDWAATTLDGRLLIYDRPGLTPQQLEGIAKTAQLTGGLDAVYVDYLGLMEAGERTENETVRISRISAALKQMSMRLGLPVIAAAQLNRDSARSDREPQLIDLRGSGSLEQDADAVIFLHTDDGKMTFNPRPVLMLVAKNRNGALAKRQMRFLPESMLLVEEGK